LVQLLTRYEKLVWEKKGIRGYEERTQAALDFLKDYPDDIWEKDWWLSMDGVFASVERIIPDAQDME
jgi:hypothetical protein